MEPPQIDPSVAAHAKLAFAALCGGIIRLIFRPAATLARSAVLLFGCITCGFYGTPVVMVWFEFSAALRDPVAALVGLVGLSLAEGLLKAVDGFNVKAWLAQWATKGS